MKSRHMKRTFVCGLLGALLLSALELGAATTSYLYVVSALSGSRVRRYAVSDTGDITLDNAAFITCNSTSDMLTSPGRIVRIGRVFYVLDLYADSALGYFSIAKYDLSGNFIGKLVNRGNITNGSTLGRADGMAASPDGKWLYVSDFYLGKIFRVSVETGEFTAFASGMSQTRDIHVTSDGKIYVAARGDKKIYVFNPDGTASTPASYSFDNQVSGIYVDETAGKVYGRYLNTMQVHNLGTDKIVENVSMPGFGFSIDKVGSKLVSGNWNVATWAPAAVLFTCDPSNAYSIETIGTNLGYVMDVYLDPNGLDAPPSVSASHTSFVANDGSLYFAADNGKSAVGTAAESTIWKSTDGGSNWAKLATVEAANPTFVEMKGGSLMLLTEPRRTASEQQTLAVAAFAADGTRTLEFVVTNKTSETFTLANGRMTSSLWGFAGHRAGIGLKTARANTMASFSFVSDKASSAYPDAVFSVTITTNSWTHNNALVRRPWSDVLPPVIFKDADGNHRELVPVEHTRSAVATRVGPECAITTENLNGSQFSPKWAPARTGYVKLPGASKAFDVVYDATSALYWAVTVPVTNVDDLAVYDPGYIRNTLAIYASTNCADWRLCKILRSEDSLETTFANPQMAIVGDDMIVAYSTMGTANAGRTVIGDNHVCQRVENFREAWPGACAGSTGMLVTDFEYACVKFCCPDPTTGDWRFSTLIPSGTYGGKTLAYLSDVVVLGTRIYVSSETLGVFCFDLKGRFRRHYALPTGTKCDAMCANPDGKSLLITDSSWINSKQDHNSVRKLDLETGAWMTLVATSTDSTFYCPRGICAKSDGSFFVASRDNSFVRHYTADGSSYTKIGTWAGSQTVALDADETHLFVGTRYGWVMKVDLSDNSYVTLAAPLSNIDSAANSITLRGGRLWLCDFGAGCVYSLDPDAAYQTPRMECSGFERTGRAALVDFSCRDGMVVIFR